MGSDAVNGLPISTIICCCVNINPVASTGDIFSL
ncbi:hypothetical protein T03_8826 [Trichinella britovi]|uniref:Uncharacterized protein n=1 Tax=Trichinella britovi TaxID=45882 RepID=A0A0V1AHX2_TRIBR|nr:hypothetical protein T03_8826 [Trichinella britovi]